MQPKLHKSWLYSKKLHYMANKKNTLLCRRVPTLCFFPAILDHLRSQLLGYRPGTLAQRALGITV